MVPLARAPVYVADLVTDPRTRVVHEVATHEGLHTLLLVPMLRGDKLQGALALYHDLVWHYEPEDFVPARTLAEELGVALVNAGVCAAATRQATRLRALTAMARVLLDGAPVRHGLATLVEAGAATAAWMFAPGGELSAQAGASEPHVDEDAHTIARRALADGDAVAVGLCAAAPVRGAGAVAVAVPRPPRYSPPPPLLFIPTRDDFDATQPDELALGVAQLLAGRLLRPSAR
jgi:hypothetical protein